MLASFELNRKKAIGWYRMEGCLDCSGKDCAKRKFPIAPLNYRGWPACPVSLLRSPRWQYIVTLSNAKVISPLSGWPGRYAVWVVEGVSALENALNSAKAA